MTGSFITISIIGFIAGFIFSMPIAGPISIMIVSSALRGRLRACNLMALGAALADFIYVLVAVYGITNLFSAYKQIIPYILGPGAILMVYIGYRIMRTKFKIDRIEEVDVDPTEKDRRAFYSGFMINFLNPTIFFGWLVSSFIVLSFASSLGFDTGGLNSMVDQNLNEIEAIDGNIKEKTEIPSYLQFDTLKIFRDVEPKPESGKSPNDYPLLTSLFYAFFVAIGSIAWFIILALLFIRFRKQLNINILNLIIRSLGLALCLFGLYFAYMALKFIF
jgi:threonine/homoserine/homoserine lactone efflux protein